MASVAPMASSTQPVPIRPATTATPATASPADPFRAPSTSSRYPSG